MKVSPIREMMDGRSLYLNDSKAKGTASFFYEIHHRASTTAVPQSIGEKRAVVMDLRSI